MSINTPKELMKEIKIHPENFYFIHYSCQNLNDENASLSPRITSIAVSHYSTGQTVSFSTHSVAETLGISRDSVIEKFNEIEKELLKEFYDFVRDRRDKYWIHWNMRNSTYGFEHIEHRYRVLGGTNAPVIPVERRINLNDIFASYYGSNYASHPKLTNLMELNGGIHRDFLGGAEEVQAFANKEFLRMHKSTLCKVGAFHSFLRKFTQGKLKTKSKGWGIFLDGLFDGRVAKGIAFVTGIIGVPGAIIGFWEPIKNGIHWILNSVK